MQVGIDRGDVRIGAIDRVTGVGLNGVLVGDQAARGSQSTQVIGAELQYRADEPRR